MELTIKVDEILFDLITARKSWIENTLKLKEQLEEESSIDKVAHLNVCASLCDVCRSMISLYSAVIRIQQLAETLIGTKPVRTSLLLNIHFHVSFINRPFLLTHFKIKAKCHCHLMMN